MGAGVDILSILSGHERSCCESKGCGDSLTIAGESIPRSLRRLIEGKASEGPQYQSVQNPKKPNLAGFHLGHYQQIGTRQCRGFGLDSPEKRAQSCRLASECCKFLPPPLFSFRNIQ